METHASTLGIRQSRWTVKFSAVAFRSCAVYLSESTTIKRTGFVNARGAAGDIRHGPPGPEMIGAVVDIKGSVSIHIGHVVTLAQDCRSLVF